MPRGVSKCLKNSIAAKKFEFSEDVLRLRHTIHAMVNAFLARPLAAPLQGPVD